jgi:pimeloyl-ACP methyl ester carboxylesterase
LYEPTIALPGAPIYPKGFVDRLQGLLDAGDREGVLTTHYRENAGMTPDEVKQFKLSPLWSTRLASAHTLPREMRAEERYRWDEGRFKSLYTPTLLLLGGDSPRQVKEAAETIARGLPNSRIAVMPGQQHIAMYTAPDRFLHEVLAFLSEPP